MTISLPAGTLIAFLLALVRASAWVAVAPPFNTRTIPALVKIGLAGALAVSVAPRLAPATSASSGLLPLATPELIGAVALQAVTGLALGFLASVLFSAIQAAGAFIDLFGGFTISTAYDPMLNAQSSVMGRVYSLLAVTLLFVLNGHLLLVRGFLTSFDAVPLTHLGLGVLARALTGGLGLLFVAAIEIAAPLLGTLFLAEVLLGLLARAAPQLNVFALGFPLKILLTLVLTGLALPLLPDAVTSMLTSAVRDGTAVLRAAHG